MAPHRQLPNIEGMRRKSAQNSRGLGERRRQPLFGKRSIDEDIPESARRFRSSINCKPPFRPPRGKLPVRPKPLPYREVSSHVLRGERSQVGAPLKLPSRGWPAPGSAGNKLFSVKSRTDSRLCVSFRIESRKLSRIRVFELSCI